MKPVLLLAVALAACGAEPRTPRGAALFAEHCAACHGPRGQGAGPLAGSLPAPPPDLTMLSAGNGGVFPASRVMTQIHGYPGRYHQGLMPEFAPLLSGPAVEWQTPEGEVIATPQALIDLAVYLDALQR